MNRYIAEITKGLWRENPIFRIVLGMCPTLAVTTSLENGIGMGIAVIFVLVCSNLVISLIRNIVPSKVRIPCYIVVIATFVTVVDMFLHAFTYKLYQNLGIFIPLIVVNCIILGRAEAFASKNGVLASVCDGFGMGMGFMLSLMVIGLFRELLGSGSITLWRDISFTFSRKYNLILMILPPGGFMVLGFLLAGINAFQERLCKKKGKEYLPVSVGGCRTCTLCKVE